MKQKYQDLILQACGASSMSVGDKIQTLWSGYGEIVRLHLESSDRTSVVVKHVKFPKDAEHPGDWNTDQKDLAADRSHTRKVRSYQVETHWYQNYSTNHSCRIPSCLAVCSHGDEMLIVLEDLDVAGYDQRRTSVRDREIRACLSWLAHFHALFLDVVPDGLWPIGTYWHLETRPDELEAMDDAELKAAAAHIDRILNECHFKTIVHGDAKLANFCFSKSGLEVAAVDFQYVGGGCGMKDVVYFLGSCMEERECEKRVPALLDHYFTELKLFINKDVNFDALEKEWREMFAFAWTDFHRFLLGWMPGHWKINRYSKQLVKEVLCKLKQSSEPELPKP
uniref:CHK kinase-like domain-containing protein n=2 Tax=Nothobranchius kadleci TaxID=1051664 RepID=A0A1A8D3U8_NOTKA